MEACVGSAWGAIATDVKDAPSCVRGCRDSLQRLLAPGEESYHVLCDVLTQLEQPQILDMFIGLYCCDAQLCGVDNIALPGYDPNVDLLINICSGLGYKPIEDPGPPPAKHTCTNTLLPSSYISCSRTVIWPTTTSTRSSSSTSRYHTSSMTTTDAPRSTTHMSETSTISQSMTSTSVSPGSTATSTSATTSTSGTGGALPSISSLVDPRLKDNISGPRGDKTGGLSTAAKIIIAAAVGGAILVAIIAVLWHYRYGRRSRQAEPQAGGSRPSLILVQPGSPTSPFVTSSPSYLARDGSPLTPPPRLKERRLLPTGSTEMLIEGGPIEGGPIESGPIESGPSRLRQGFHLPTGSRTGIASSSGSTTSPAAAMNAAAAGTALATERQPSGPMSPNSGRGPRPSPTRSQFASILYASSLADPGPPPSRDLPSAPSRTATTRSGSRSHGDVSPNEIGVALEFPPRENDLSTQISKESGESSESKIMTGPMRGTWGDSWTTSRNEAPAGLAPQTPTTRRPSRGPILQEQELARMAGSY